MSVMQQRRPAIRNPFGSPMMSFMDVASSLQPAAQQRTALDEGDVDDIASQYASQPSAAAPTPNPMITPDEREDTAPVQSVLGSDPDPQSTPNAQHASGRRALANALLQGGQQERQGGALGALARVAQSVGGSYEGMKAQEEEDANKAATSAEWQKILANSPDEQTLVNNMMRSPIPEIRDRAVEAQLKSRLTPKPAGTGFKVGSLQNVVDPKDGTFHQREMTGNGWLDRGRIKPPADPNALPSGFASREDMNDAVDMRVGLAMAGKYDAAFKGLRGKDGQMLSNMINSGIARKMKEKGWEGPDLVLAMSDVDGLRTAINTIQARTAKIDMSAHEVNQFADYALGASKEVPRGDIKLVNGWANWLRGQRSDANQASFEQYNLAVASAAAVVAGRGEVNQPLQEEFRQKLDTAKGPEAYKAVIRGIKQEAQGMLKVGHQMIDEQRQAYRNRQAELGVNLEGSQTTPMAAEGAAPAGSKPDTRIIDGYIWKRNPKTGKLAFTGQKAQ